MNRALALQQAFRHQLVRAVTGISPAEPFVAANNAALQKLAGDLADWEQARAMLRAKGYGDIGTSLLEVVNAIPEKAKA